MQRDATIKQLREDLDASAADIEAGRIVPGEVVIARLEQALVRYESRAGTDSSPCIDDVRVSPRAPS
jgi:hypothetical protein